MIRTIIVDDELLMRIGLKSMIDWEAHGFRIVGEAANGKEALEIARLQPPDLIITDIKMPVMDGLELIRQAALLFDGCQYIILSCLDEFRYAQEALRLGAFDYLIKSDIKEQQLLNVLQNVKQHIEKTVIRRDGVAFKERYQEGIGYLKASLLKELISGLCSEQEVIARSEALQISLTQGPMVLVKLRIDRFEDIRRKYVEQDEKLLRYAVVNILEEIIPRKWRREIIVESSSAYLCIMNVNEPDLLQLTDRLRGLFEKILAAMKDFLNVSMSIGVSGLASGFGGLKKAYQEADLALRQLFFEETACVMYYDALGGRLRQRDHFGLSREQKETFRQLVESGGQGAFDFLEEWKQRLKQEDVSEKAVRKGYIHLLSLITSCFPNLPESGEDGLTLYERLLREERLEGVHRLVKDYLRQCLHENRALQERPQSYAEQARAIIMSQYANDISLHSVARQIGVNPSYLSRVFKQETGENFTHFLTRVRMEKAKHYLKEKRLKVYEVANQVGYQNTTYFSKIFKKVTGITPEEFRG